MARKTWRQKFDGAPAPHVAVLEKTFAGVPAGAKLFIASPQLVRDYVEAIPRGKTSSIRAMRDAFARRHKADATCPLTSGIFARIVAEVALERIAGGEKPAEVTPFWRLIDPKDAIARKLSCGPDFIASQRAIEAGRAA